MYLWEVIEPVLSLATAVSSLVVASVVGLSVIEAQKDQRIHNRISVQPGVRIDKYCIPSKGIYQIFLRNSGVGPAYLKEVRFRTYLDSELKQWNKDNVQSYLSSLLSAKGEIKVTLSSVNDATALAVNGEIPILDVQISDGFKDLLNHEAIKKIRDGIAFNIRFESIYGEHFEQEDKLLQG